MDTLNFKLKNKEEEKKKKKNKEERRCINVKKDMLSLSPKL